MKAVRLQTLLLFTSACFAAAQGCSWQDALGPLPQLSTLQKLLNATGAELPANATEVSTLLLPSAAAFTELLSTLGITEAELSTLSSDDPELLEQVNAVLMMHVLPLPGLSLTQLAAASPFPTATSLINGTGVYNVSVSQDLKSVKAALNDASVLNTVKVCNGLVYTIDKVLLAAALEDMPLVSADDIAAFFAGDFNTTVLSSAAWPSPAQQSPSPSLSPFPPSPSPPPPRSPSPPPPFPSPSPSPPPPSSTPSPASTGITMTEVAKHNTRTSLWIVVDAKVYDITAYLGQHPGGDSVMLKWGGQDATQIFYSSHRGNQAFTDLDSYYTGDLAA